MVCLSGVIMAPSEANRHTVSAMPFIDHGCIVSDVSKTSTEAHGHTVNVMSIIIHGALLVM